MLIDSLGASDREALERFRANQYGLDIHDDLRRLHDAAAALRGLLDAQAKRDAEMSQPITPALLAGAGFSPVRHALTGVVNTWTRAVGECHVLVSMPSPGLDEWGVSILQAGGGSVSFTRRNWGDIVRLVEALEGGVA